jgi:L-lactate utilization protein LutB
LAARRLKEGIEEPRYCDNHETVLNSESIDAFVSDIVKAIAEEVKTATEAKMARGKYIYAHEVAEDAVEIIESFAQDKEEHGKV